MKFEKLGQTQEDNSVVKRVKTEILKYGKLSLRYPPNRQSHVRGLVSLESRWFSLISLWIVTCKSGKKKLHCFECIGGNSGMPEKRV